MSVQPTYDELRHRVRDLENELASYRKINETLQEQEALFQGLIKNSHLAFFTLNCEGCFTYANSIISRFSGLSAAEIIGRPFENFICPEDLPRIKKFMAGNLEGLCRPYDFRIKASDGSLTHMLSFTSPIIRAGEKIGIGGAMTDIPTDGNHLSLLRNADRYRLLVEKSKDILCTLDMELNFTFVSPSASTIFGYATDELMQLKITDILPEESISVAAQDLSQAIRVDSLPQKDDLRSGNLEMKARHKDGHCIWIEVKRSFLRGSDDQPTGIVIIARDISKRKLAESQKEQLEKQLFHAQKMEALGTLAGGIVHDFNNILTGIQGYTSLILVESQPDEHTCQRIKNIEHYVERGAELAGQLLGFAREDSHQLLPCDLNEIIRESADIFGRSKREITISLCLEPQLPCAETDRGQLEQVLLNIFVNAWQAMPQGGELEISSFRKTIVLRQAKVLNINPAEYAVISIKDSGCGIKDEHLSRIFEPFFSTKEKGHGTGLGLASAYGIIKKHGGTITVKSKEGQGSTFFIYLPLPPESASTSTNPQKNAAIEPRDITVLLADDEDMVMQVAPEMLKHLGCRVITATSGDQALEAFRHHSDEIDMAIIDMVMPGMQPDQLIEGLRNINPAVKIILSSGYGRDETTVKALLDRCDGFIQKPFRLETLTAVLE